MSKSDKTSQEFIKKFLMNHNENDDQLETYREEDYFTQTQRDMNTMGLENENELLKNQI